MKIINYRLIVVMLCYSCSKDIEVDKGIENFSITTESSTYKVGDEVTFEFKGNANMITFYSGELFSDYAFREGRTAEINSLSLSFSSAIGEGAQSNQLSVMVSSDFNGDYNDFEQVQSATWTDVTDRFRYPTNSTFVASTVQSIDDLRVSGKPLYIAFRYITKPQLTFGVARPWHTRSFLVNSNTSIGPLTLADQSNVGFKLVTSAPENVSSMSGITVTQVNFYPNQFTLANDLQTEIWAISRPIEVGTLQYPGDRPVSLKGVAASQLKRHTYIYNKAGVYEAYFVAANVNIYNRQQVVKRIELTITD